MTQIDGVQRHVGYRPEIDGLRAISVLAVMVYHAGVSQLAGGYLGVDVFFVISGFLITGIIIREIEAGSFTARSFYLRRIRRIIPALTVMLLLCLPFAIWLMLPDDLENFGQSVVATVLSANNVLLYATADYFQLEALYKPLVHTWSLGVEEQYYVLVPLLLVALMRWGRRRAALAGLVAISLGSLMIAQDLHRDHPNANFYLLPSRMWELGLGGIAAMVMPAINDRVKQPWIGQALALVGLIALAVPLFVFDEEMGLPAWPALVPVVGACLVLGFARRDVGIGRLLGWRPLVFIGLISYSAYLYHQPLYAFTRVARLDEPGPDVLLFLIVPTLVLAWFSWRFVERPFRDPRRVSTAKLLWSCAAGSVLAAGVGLALHLTSGLYARWPELADGDPMFGANQNIAFNEAPFVFRDRAFTSAERDYNLLVIGDSFARDFINMGLETGRLAGFAINYSQINQCGPLSHADLAQAARAGTVVLASGVTEETIPCTLYRIDQLEAVGAAHIVALGNKNFGFNNNAVMRLPPRQRYAYRTQVLAPVLRDSRAARRLIPQRYYLDLLALIDEGGTTVPVFTPEAKFISQDRRHLTRAGARFLGERVFAAPHFRHLPPPR